MSLQRIRFFCCILLIIIAQSAQSNPNASAMRRNVVTFADAYRVEVEIADTEALRQLGLMHRLQLDEDKGMLFVYQNQAIRAVWMKNTLIPLDVLFLSSDGKVLSMLPNLQPCKKDPCPVFTSRGNAQYMLEVTAGFIDKHRIELGQKLFLDYTPDKE